MRQYTKVLLYCSQRRTVDRTLCHLHRQMDAALTMTLTFFCNFVAKITSNFTVSNIWTFTRESEAYMYICICIFPIVNNALLSLFFYNWYERTFLQRTYLDMNSFSATRISLGMRRAGSDRISRSCRVVSLSIQKIYRWRGLMDPSW